MQHGSDPLGTKTTIWMLPCTTGTYTMFLSVSFSPLPPRQNDTISFIKKGQVLWMGQFCLWERTLNQVDLLSSDPTSWCFRYSIRTKQAYAEKNPQSPVISSSRVYKTIEYSNQLSFEFRKYYMNTKTDGKLD